MAGAGTLLLTVTATQACTGFVFKSGEIVYAGGNEDYDFKEFNIWFEPAATEDEYGSVFIGYEIAEGRYFPFHGLNTAGLYYDSFGSGPKDLTEMRKLPQYDGERELFEDVLMKTATVEEAIEFLSGYYHELYEQNMALYGDAAGNAAVKEGDVVVRSDDDDFVLTNFMLSKTDKPLEACDRYRMTTEMLDAGEPSLELARAILSNTHNEGRNATKYSVICDLTNQIMYIYYFHNFEEVYVLNLKEELKQGRRRFPLKDLFSENWQEKVWTVEYGPREPDEEAEINRLGYALLAHDLVDAAIQVFTANTEHYPNSWNTWDSLGEAYHLKGDRQKAAEYYKRSVELNPDNTNGKKMLEELE
ncbi:MAG: tetratricopeptide repeat protein [Candidatus Eisenbacteria bacterium]|uniref:Tetratricopeptide repeat protein n=1 Tax=Eiseniibacteriota bacterium TaxID=2212470 RepID=A0A948W652_UNCEI|nr:tetratricopeptide repeat protein [Candidatus Eisenbacteria bacterium]MBU2691149.1 tetratricopeptide repeat protein [Candidatus Eisenbacteria bacterium]